MADLGHQRALLRKVIKEVQGDMNEFFYLIEKAAAKQRSINKKIWHAIKETENLPIEHREGK